MPCNTTTTTPADPIASRYGCTSLVREDLINAMDRLGASGNTVGTQVIDDAPPDSDNPLAFDDDELGDPKNKHKVAHWKFKSMNAVDGQGEVLDAVQDAARQKLEDAAQAKEEAATKAEAFRADEVRSLIG